MTEHPRVLVYDDDETILQLLSDVLAPTYNVLTTYDPRQAFDLVSTREFGLLIIDLRPSGTEGCSVDSVDSYLFQVQ